MRESWTAAKVGILVVVVLAASFGIYRLVDERSGGGSGYEVYAVFNDVTGLVPKSRVLIAGIPVGYIERIRLWGARARVDIHVNEGIELHADGVVAKRSASILGESMLFITPGTPSARLLANGEQIAAQPESGGTDQILDNVARISDSILRVAQQVERTFGTDEGGRQMQVALQSLSEALEAINRTIQANEAVVNRSLANVEGITSDALPKIAAILENIQEVTADVRRLVNNNEGNVDETVESVERTARELEAVIADVHTVTDRTARGEGTIGRLTTDETIVNEVENVAQGIGDFVGGIDRLQTIVGLRTEYHFLANTMKNYVELRLQPREDRYYYIQLVNDPRGLTSYEEEVITETPPREGVPEVRQVRTVRTRDAFRFSLGFAKRISFATFRFGVIESTGGVGLDLHFFNNNLEINNDVFAFGEQAYPRFRTNLAFQIVSRLWILGGVDDYLNSTRDFYFGAMLRFNDEDLKSILPFAGGLASGAGG